MPKTQKLITYPSILCQQLAFKIKIFPFEFQIDLSKSVQKNCSIINRK